PSSSTCFPYTTLFRSFLLLSGSARDSTHWQETEVKDLQAPALVITGRASLEILEWRGLICSDWKEARIPYSRLGSLKTWRAVWQDRKSTRLNSSHDQI